MKRQTCMRRAAAVAVIVAGAALAACASTRRSGESESPVSVATSTSVPTPTDGGPTLRFGAVSERSIDVEADGRNTTAAVRGMNAFALDLFRAVATNQAGNVIVSPYSVEFCLGMIYAGARGPTAAEMASVLHADIPADEWHEGINAYDLTLNARTAASPTTWTAANKVWTAPVLSLRDEYLDILAGMYGSPLAVADFTANADAERVVINRWVAEHTQDRIVELFPPDSLTPQTRLVLVNAVALDAPWEFPFDPAATSDQLFTRSDGTTVSVPMMRYDEYLPSATTDAYTMVEIPYGGGALSMVVIVPNDLATFEAALTTESLTAAIGLLEDGGIHLSLPRWTARTHVTLNDALAALGMPAAFTPSADFSGMVDSGGLWIDRVEHEAYIEVDEDGTRAAAATGGVMVASHGPTVAVNRPYLYIIRDRGAGAILFIGRVTDPSITQ